MLIEEITFAFFQELSAMLYPSFATLTSSFGRALRGRIALRSVTLLGRTLLG